MFTGEGPDVGFFTIKNSKVNLEILPAVYEMKDGFVLSVLEGIQSKIVTEELLEELISTSSPHSSLQFYRF